MISKENIVCIAYTTWGGDYVKSTVKLMGHLAKDNKLLFVEYPFTIKDVVFSFLKKQIADYKRILGLRSRLQRIKAFSGAEVYILTVPPGIPYAKIRNKALLNFVLKINAAIIKPSIMKAMRKLQMDKPIVINTFNPFYGLHLAGKLREKLHLYYCYDAISSDRYGDMGLIVEELFAKKTDGIIASSDMLKKIKSAYNSNCSVVKNGVDFAHFNDYYKTHTKKVQKKIGYIGSVDWRFEAEMISWVASKMPDYIFEIVGRIANEEAKKILSSQANVKFHPPVSPNDVPAIMFNCDCGIIPYSRHEENKNVYPLKINEYLAVGTPVVMTDFADLPEFNTLVGVASTKEEFLEAILHEISNNSAELEQRRVEFASNNSWEARADEFSNIIQSFINN